MPNECFGVYSLQHKKSLKVFKQVQNMVKVDDFMQLKITLKSTYT